MVPELQDQGFGEKRKKVNLPSLRCRRDWVDNILTYKYTHSEYTVNDELHQK